MLKVAVLADIGQPVYHVGDEAMGHAVAEELRGRGIDVLMLSRNPSQTRELYGTDAALTLQFPWPPLDRERYLEEISRALAGDKDALPSGDQVWDFFRVIEACDAVVIAGGGNMNSGYGWLLYERAALGLVAAHYGKPLVVSGQTFGPALTAQDSQVLAALLESAQLVGAREDTSHRLAHELGVPAGKLTAGLDDAAFFAVAEPASGTSYIAATFSPGTGTLPGVEYVERIAAVLDELVEVSGLGVVLIPHMADTGSRDQDLAVHRQIAAAMRTDNVELAELLPASEAAALTAGAALVVSSRYHPAVFAAGAGVPAVSLSTDHYSDARLSGALRNWGLEQFNLPMASLLDGGFRAAVLAAWEQRAGIAAHLRDLGGQRRADSQNWWDGVVLALQGERPPAPAGLSPAASYPAEGSWQVAAGAARRVGNPLGTQASVAELERQREHGLHQAAVVERDQARAELERLLGSRAFRAAATAWSITGKFGMGKKA